jgi:hypothetical protein
MNEPSRRDLFRQAGAVGAAAAMTGSQFVPSAEAVAQPQVTAIAPPQLEALESLTALEADTRQAVVARLIPADENGPGAAEAKDDRALNMALDLIRGTKINPAFPPNPKSATLPN